MFMEHLALTYKCHSSIGNSLDLKVMITEVLSTFIEDTNAKYGFFYLIDEDNRLYKYISYSDEYNFEADNYKNSINQFNILDIDNNEKLLILPLEKGIIYIIYENNDVNFEFIGSMFQDLVVKLNISIDACLNVQKMKNKNKMLKLLTNEMKQQQKELLESDKYKSNFLANMSHELKTPLNSIIVISSIMGKNKKNKLDEEQVKNMKIINSCGNDLLVLINDILDISKIEAGEISISLSKININQLIEDLVSEMEPLVIQRGLVLEFNCLLNDINLLSDPHRIKQILKNLLSNAIKFTDDGIIDVVLEENANDITIKVIDQGIGIAQEKLGHIFDRFKQADGSTTRKYGGTGLGLSISKELSHLLGGDIKAFSKLGVGSTFELILPKKTNIKNISDDNVSISSSKEENDEIEDIVLFDMEDLNIKDELAASKTTGKILIINGDHTLLFPVAIALKKHDISIEYATSLNSAMEVLESDLFDVMIIDEENTKAPIDEFVNYCNEKHFKLIIISSKESDNENYINRDLVKSELVNKTLKYLGK